MSEREKQRIAFHSLFTQEGWRVTQSGQTVSSHKTQKEAERATVFAGRAILGAGGLGRAVLHKKDGSVREERNYGRERRKTLG